MCVSTCSETSTVHPTPKANRAASLGRPKARAEGLGRDNAFQLELHHVDHSIPFACRVIRNTWRSTRHTSPRREPEAERRRTKAHARGNGSAPRRPGAVPEPVTGREHVPGPQAAAEQQRPAAPEAEASHHQPEASDDSGGGARGVPAAGARGEQRRRRRVRPAHHAAGAVQRGGRGRGADPRAEPAAGEAVRRRRGVAGAPGGAARQRVQPQAGPVRNHPGEARGAAPRPAQALLRPLQQRHQRECPPRRQDFEVTMALRHDFLIAHPVLLLLLRAAGLRGQRQGRGPGAGILQQNRLCHRRNFLQDHVVAHTFI
jgi:hypothetical protein